VNCLNKAAKGIDRSESLVEKEKGKMKILMNKYLNNERLTELEREESAVTY
jgi:hypothetical protein